MNNVITVGGGNFNPVEVGLWSFLVIQSVCFFILLKFARMKYRKCHSDIFSDTFSNAIWLWIVWILINVFSEILGYWLLISVNMLSDNMFLFIGNNIILLLNILLIMSVLFGFLLWPDGENYLQIKSILSFTFDSFFMIGSFFACSFLLKNEKSYTVFLSVALVTLYVGFFSYIIRFLIIKFNP